MGFIRRGVAHLRTFALSPTPYPVVILASQAALNRAYDRTDWS